MMMARGAARVKRCGVARPRRGPGTGGGRQAGGLSLHEAAHVLDMVCIKPYICTVAERRVSDMADQDELFFISMAARQLGMHPQTLRKYERLGLVQPTRTIGAVRVYSRGEIDRLRLIKHLVDEVGVNLAGVQRLLDVAEVVRRMQPMVTGKPLATQAARRRLARELEHLMAMLGL